jgi:hypothetical protein
MTSTDEDSAGSLIEALEAARRERERAEKRVAEIGEDSLDTLQSYHDEFTTLLARYEDRASGSGDFQAFVKFQEELEAFTADLPEDLPERETFEEIDDRLQKRRLTESDFEWAYERLEPVEALIDRLAERSEADRLVETTTADISEAIRDTRERIDRLETVRKLGAADLDAPVFELRDPIERYNESVRSAVTEFRRSAPARRVLSVLHTARRFPLVPVPEPPEDLHSYLAAEPVGQEPIPTLLEYAEYSRSKLAHYVESPATFARVVGGNRTYLDGIDGEPFTIEWPPPPADRLRYRGRELIAVLSRFAPEETVAAFREVYELARADPERYATLRLTARARNELTAEERSAIAAGTVEDDLAAARDRLETLRDVLDR